MDAPNTVLKFRKTESTFPWQNLAAESRVVRSTMEGSLRDVGRDEGTEGGSLHSTAIATAFPLKKLRFGWDISTPEGAITDLPTYIDTLGMREKCYFKQVVTLTTSLSL